MMQVERRYEGDGVGLIAIADAGDVGAVTQRAPQLGIAGHVALASESADATFQVRHYPMTFLLDAQGRVLDVLDRGQTAASFEQRLQAALARSQ